MFICIHLKIQGNPQNQVTSQYRKKDLSLLLFYRNFKNLFEVKHVNRLEVEGFSHNVKWNEIHILALGLSAALSLFSETGNDYSLTHGDGGKMKLKGYKKGEIRRKRKSSLYLADCHLLKMMAGEKLKWKQLFSLLSTFLACDVLDKFHPGLLHNSSINQYALQLTAIIRSIHHYKPLNCSIL